LDDFEILKFNIKKRMIDTNKKFPDVIARMKTDGITLRKIVKGTSTGCNLSTISDIADALGVNAAWLLTDHEKEAARIGIRKVEDQTHKLGALTYSYEKIGEMQTIKINGIAIPSEGIADVDLQHMTALITIPLDEISVKR